MNYRNTLLAAGAALAATAGLAQAQYDFNWAQTANTNGPLFGFTGNDLFGTLSQAAGGNPTGNWGPGNSIRVCYGIDTTSGGSFWNNGGYTTRWLRVRGAYAGSNPTPGVSIGLSSIQSASTPSTDGDACFTPFVLQPSGTLNLNVGALFAGTFAGTVPPFPTAVTVALDFGGTDPITGPTELGLDPNLAALGFNTPLLANVIYETQGPADAGPANIQYYLAGTSEATGTNLAGPGGVANGLVDYASGIFAGAPDPVTTNAISHTRITSFDAASGTFAAWTLPFGAPGEWEFRVADLSFTTPQLWASKNGNYGAGGPDWQVSAAPTSTVNVRLRDVLSGAETAAGSAVQNPCLLPITNISLFVWSSTAATAMQQNPTSWSTLAVPFLPPQRGSLVLGLVATARQGFQNVPIEFDTLTQTFLNSTALTQGQPFSAAYDPADGINNDALFGGSFVPMAAGISTVFAGGGAQLVAVPTPTLGGVKIGLASLGVQFSLCTGAVSLMEFGSSLEVQFQ